jgi:23S rRNA (cytidine2498-2'-O)-methyltransferase
MFPPNARLRLCTCQSGYEATLVRELGLGGARTTAFGPGWALAEFAAEPEGAAEAAEAGGTAADEALAGGVFSHLLLEAPVAVTGPSVNGLAHALFEYFAGSLRDERIEAPWPCVFAGALEPVGLGQRVESVEKAFGQILGKNFGRLAKLASPTLPRGLGPTRGLFVWFTDFGHAFAARVARRRGQRRMADDPLAPSRSYLKVEEAYGIIGAEPRAGETVCDLGAAPGGWSYSAAKRGAEVVAVDNGPLKGGALGHPRIAHRCADAFQFTPAPGQVFDWLFCDLVEEPHHVLRSIVAPWLAGRRCRRFIVNLKLGRVDPIALLQELAAPESPLRRHGIDVRLRHLYHDRDEITAMGGVKP